MDGKWARRIVSILIAAGLVSFLILLAAHAYAGWFSRYMADDYSSASILRDRGLVGSQITWYTTWSGRYAFTLAVNLVELVGVKAVPFLPAATLVIWVLAASWTITEASRTFGRIAFSRLGMIIMALVLVLVTFSSNSRLIQVLYWQTGILTYPAPLILITLYWGWIFKMSRGQSCNRENLTRPGWPLMAVSLFFAFMAGGFSETSGTFQVALLGIGWLLCRLIPNLALRRTAITLLLCGLLGALLAMVVMGLAPGNALRQAQAGAQTHLDLWRIGQEMLQFNARFIYRWFAARPFIAGSCFVFPLLVGLSASVAGNRPVLFSSWKTPLWIALGILLATVGLMVASTLPAEVVMGAAPPYRAQLVTQAPLTVGVGALGFLAGLVLQSFVKRQRRWLAPALALTLVFGMGLAIGLLVEVRSTLDRAEVLRQNAAGWDDRDAYLKAAATIGQRQVEVPLLRDIGQLGDLRVETDFWINLDAARYYGLESIKAVGPELPKIE